MSGSSPHKPRTIGKEQREPVLTGPCNRSAQFGDRDSPLYDAKIYYLKIGDI